MAKFEGAVIFCIHPVTHDVVFVSRKGCPDKLGVMPGGKLEPDETPRDAAIREFQEETGLVPSWVSSKSLFSGVAKASGALCSVFLGTLSESDCESVKNEFIGPEGLKVQAAPWYLIAREECCEFAEYNKRFLQSVQANAADLRPVFSECGLESSLAQIKQYSL